MARARTRFHTHTRECTYAHVHTYTRALTHAQTESVREIIVRKKATEIDNIVTKERNGQYRFTSTNKKINDKKRTLFCVTVL